MLFLHTDPAVYLRQNIRTLGEILGTAGLMMLVGLWDDLKNISSWKKFIAQSLVGFLCWLLGFRILAVWAGEALFLQWGLSLLLTVLWIVFITNAFNLIDGMDGLAAGSALFATLALLMMSVLNNLPLSALILFALAGSVVGFLRYNFCPASIFLGDSGSYLLGFLLAILSLRGSQKSTTALAIAVPLVALTLPVVDTSLAIARRFIKGKPIFSADKHHIHHVLIQRGFGTRHAVILLYGVSGLFGLISLLFINPGSKTSGVILAIIGVCILFGIQQLNYPELRGLGGHLFRGLQNQRQLIAGSAVVAQMIDSVQKAKNLNDVMRAIGTGLEEMCFWRFELILHRVQVARTSKLERGWMICDAVNEGLTLTWLSRCKTCDRRMMSPRFISIGNLSGNSWDEFPCENCNELKNGVLQKQTFFKLCHLEKSVSENQLIFPLQGREGTDLGVMKLYYPGDIDYPASAIAVLSQNFRQELESVIQKL
jgi:UDP-N-acetylmuramyl pentapeptide phosphotransferase/UDP-N-acetylglucosamine-1-phosphate transferase